MWAEKYRLNNTKTTLRSLCTVPCVSSMKQTRYIVTKIFIRKILTRNRIQLIHLFSDSSIHSVWQKIKSVCHKPHIYKRLSKGHCLLMSFRFIIKQSATEIPTLTIEDAIFSLNCLTVICSNTKRLQFGCATIQV